MKFDAGEEILNKLLTAEELACLENAEMPQPLLAEKFASITEPIYEEYHSDMGSHKSGCNLEHSTRISISLRPCLQA